MSEKYLKSREAAEYINSSASTLAKLRILGAGPKFVRIGRRAIRYPESELDRWLEKSLTNHAATRTARWWTWRPISTPAQQLQLSNLWAPLPHGGLSPW
jgi:predicted DNA-binding transcriptional regulator AlpA